ncbi:MAG: aminoacyl-tRNA hydrolase [Candidatus Omnitrophica bacterium]|nr:aminoacyl-tRNA hydrolase [Candidatus Omnitrophota bacterium]MCM8807173.1 aminoacyl-tRNA hydrolase [Candidatus Omnitrophota bacterium]
MLFAGLGNPGKEYKKTRHNIGFEVIDELKKISQIKEIYRKKFFCGWKVILEEKEVFLIKPKTYMNESGKAIKSALDFFDEKIENLFLIHDDLDIELGKIKIIKDRGPGGHKGVISVMENLKSNNFVRIRFGIKGEKIETNFINYVLSPFLPEEEKIVEATVKKVISAIKEILRSNLEKAMSLYNN